jgi:hypothetical protein
MKVGDLVKWSDLAIGWHAINNAPYIADARTCGLIYSENHKFYFIHWINGDQRAEDPENLEVISESR